MNEIEKLPVTRENIFRQASRYLDAERKTPTLPSIRDAFETPTSPSIGVYLREWKEAHAEEIRLNQDTKQSWRAKATHLETHLIQVSQSLSDLSNELANLNDWLASNHPGIFQEYQDYGRTEE